MSEIIVRYQCDGCYQEADTLEELNKVEIKIWRGGKNGEELYLQKQWRLYCNNCLKERSLNNPFPEVGGVRLVPIPPPPDLDLIDVNG